MLKAKREGLSGWIKDKTVAACACMKGMAALLVCALVAVMFCAPSVFAGTPSMPAVEFPIDPTSIGDAIRDAGATILMIVFTVGIGFALAWVLYRRLRRAV